MTSSSTPVSVPAFDRDAVLNIATYWLDRIALSDGRESCGGAESLEALFGLMDQYAEAQAVSPEYAMSLGFRFGITIAAAVASDPLGNPTSSIAREAAAIKAELDAARLDNRKTHDRRTADSAKKPKP